MFNNNKNIWGILIGEKGLEEDLEEAEILKVEMGEKENKCIKQSVPSVAHVVKYLLGHQVTNQFIAQVALRIEVEEMTDMIDMIDLIEGHLVDQILKTNRCLVQLAINVTNHVKCLSNHLEINQSTATIALGKVEKEEKVVGEKVEQQTLTTIINNLKC